MYYSTFTSSLELTDCLCRLIGASKIIGDNNEANSNGSLRELVLEADENRERRMLASSKDNRSWPSIFQSSNEAGSSGNSSPSCRLARNLFAISRLAIAKFKVNFAAFCVFAQSTKLRSRLYNPGSLSLSRRRVCFVLVATAFWKSARVLPQSDKNGQPYPLHNEGNTRQQESPHTLKDLSAVKLC